MKDTSTQLLDTKGFRIESLREGGIRLFAPRPARALLLSGGVGVVLIVIGLMPLFLNVGRMGQIAFLAVFTAGFALILSAWRTRVPVAWFIDPVNRRLERRRGEDVLSALTFDEIESVSAADVTADEAQAAKAGPVARTLQLKTRYGPPLNLAVLSPADAETALRALADVGLPVERG